jgi:hypothetical protein
MYSCSSIFHTHQRWNCQDTSILLTGSSSSGYSKPFLPTCWESEFVSNSRTTYHTYPYDNFVYPIFTVFPWCQRTVVSGSSGIYVVKTSTTRATPVVADTVFRTSTPHLDTLYHCTSPRQSYRWIPLQWYSHDNVLVLIVTE